MLFGTWWWWDVSRALDALVPVAWTPSALSLRAQFCRNTKWVSVNILSGAAPALNWWTLRSRTLTLDSSSPYSLIPIPVSSISQGLAAHFASSALSFFAGLQHVSPLITFPQESHGPADHAAAPILLAPCLARDGETTVSPGYVQGIQNSVLRKPWSPLLLALSALPSSTPTSQFSSHSF